jgi:hypothetical protein
LNNTNNLVHPAPVDLLIEDELSILINKLGSLLYILKNKKINHTKLLYELIKNKNFRKICLNVTTIETFELLVTEIIKRCPDVIRSKHLLKIKN